MAFLLSLSPVLLIAVLAVGFKRSAMVLALSGTALTLLLALTYFRTAPHAMLLAALDGIVSNLPVLLMVSFGILLSGVLMEMGSLARIVAWLLGRKHSEAHKLLLLSFGVGNFLEGAGVVAEPVAAPMMKASGMNGDASAILSVQGYAGVMALSVGGVILVVTENITGLPVSELGLNAAFLSLPALAFMLAGVPFVSGKTPGLGRAWPLFVLSFVVVGGVALATTYLVSYSVAGLFAGIVLSIVLLGVVRRLPRLDRQILRDLAPFVLLVVCLGAINLIPGLKSFVNGTFSLTVSPVPIHPVVIRPLASAYTYLFLALLFALWLFRGEWQRVKPALAVSLRKAAKPVLAMALFGVMGQILAFTGYAADFIALTGARNVPAVLAQGLVHSTGGFYPLFAPLLGWVGTFLTGYGVASIVLFGQLQFSAAAALGVSPQVLVAALVVGTGVGSISSPLKLAMAASLVGAAGREGAMLRRTIPLGLTAALAVGVAALFMA